MEQTSWTCDYCRVMTTCIMAENAWVAFEGTLVFFNGDENNMAVPVKRIDPMHHFCSIGHLILWLKRSSNEKRKEIANE